MSHEPLLFPDPTVDRRQASTCTSPSGSKTAVNGDSKPELASREDAEAFYAWMKENAATPDA